MFLASDLKDVVGGHRRVEAGMASVGPHKRRSPAREPPRRANAGGCVVHPDDESYATYGTRRPPPG